MVQSSGTRVNRKKHHHTSYFRATSTPLFLRAYSLYHIFKVISLSALLGYLALSQWASISSHYGSLSTCQQCLLTSQSDVTRFFEFSSCQHFFVDPNGPQILKQANLLTESGRIKDGIGPALWSRSIVQYLPVISYIFLAMAVLAVLTLIYSRRNYGESNHFEDQSSLYSSNLLIGGLTSASCMWFINTIYSVGLSSSCYVTVLSPVFVLLSACALLVLLVFGIVCFRSFDGWQPSVFGYIGGVLLLGYMSLLVYMGVENFLSFANVIPVMFCGMLFLNVVELPVLHYLHKHWKLLMSSAFTHTESTFSSDPESQTFLGKH